MFSLLFINLTAFPVLGKDDVSVVLHSTTSFTDPGRVSDSFCERDAMVKFMHGIRSAVNRSTKPITIISLAKPGNREPVDAVQLINRIKPDICFVFSAYKTENSIPECTIYWYTWSSSMIFPIKGDNLIFVPEAEAYRISYDTTFAYVQALKKEFYASIKHWGSVSFVSCPLVPLRGIVVPAVLIEIGLSDVSLADSYGELVGRIIATIV